MWITVGVVTAAAVIFMVEVPTLWKKRLVRELAVFMMLLLFGTGLSIAQSLRMKIPTPLDWINTMFRPMGEAIFSLLK